MVRVPRKPSRSLILCLAIVPLLAAPARATTVRRMSLTDLVGQAEGVMRARALANRVRTDPDTLLHYTITRFEVLEGVKGPHFKGDEVEVEVIGGTAPGSDWTTVVADAPRFRAGEEVILFTVPGPGERKAVAGFFQGVIRVRQGPEGAEVSSPPLARPGAKKELRLAPRQLAPVHIKGRPSTAEGAAAGETATGMSAAPASGSSRVAGPAATSPSAGGRVKVAEFMERLRSIHARLQDEP